MSQTKLQVDVETVQKVLESMDISSVPVLDSNTISECALKFPSLTQRDNSRDETTRVKVQLAELVSPSSYIISIKKLQGFYLNPCIVFTNYDSKRNQREVLMSWRKANTDREVLSFGWLNLETMQVNQSLRRPDNYFMGSLTTSQEDARLLVTPDRRLVTVYTGNHGLRKRTKMFCSLGTWNASSLELSFENSYYLHYEDSEHQKNWIPFMYNDTLLFIQKFIPLTTLTISNRDENYKATMKVFSVNDRQNKSTPLPWKGDAYGDSNWWLTLKSLIYFSEYITSIVVTSIANVDSMFTAHSGSEIRGGSTAVFVDNGYLLFFHTLSMQHGIRNYFMGCMHLCPHPPFTIRAMSAFPVLKGEWYDGKTITTYSSYFPSLFFSLSSITKFPF